MLKWAIWKPSETGKDLLLPTNDEERTSIREQLDRIIASPMFKNSVRGTTLLRYVVERMLNGHVDHIKERTIGIEAFGRDATYDTNEDPVVRNTAVAVRRRLAQYYEDPRPEDKIRIDLPAGGYTPEFRKFAKDVHIESSHRVPQRRLAITLVSVGMAATLAGLVFWLTSRISSSALQEFWSSAVGSSESVLICMGGVTSQPASFANQLGSESSLTGSTALALSKRQGAYADSIALSRIAGLMMIMKKQFQVRLDTEVELAHFKSEPVILIGGIRNQWNSRLLHELRFHIENDDQISWISDRLNPNKRNFSMMGGENPEKNINGYALISRISDSTIGQSIVSIAGMSALTVEAAAEFLTDEVCMEKIAAGAPKSWYRKNMQIVISMRLDPNSFGPPKVEVVHFW